MGSEPQNSTRLTQELAGAVTQTHSDREAAVGV